MQAPESAYAIAVDDLTRTFRGPQGRVKRAVDGLSLQVERGEMVGLLGPNGAGKTSTVKILMTVLLPTSGRARVLGYDVVADAQTVRRRTGVILGGDQGLYARLSARDNLLLFADLYGLPYREQKKRVPELLDMVGLSGEERKRVESYSRGMKQRLHIARGLLHDPDVVILDEPSNGIDPVGARELRALVREQVHRGRTVLLTTHYMFEADELCDRVVVMRDGRKIAEGTPESLKKQTDGQVVLTVHLNGAGEDDVARVRALPGIQSVSLSERDAGQVLDVHSGQRTDVTAAVLAELRDVSVLQVFKREPTLEDAYVSLIAGAAR
ncbi:daunorubicin resistance protein DrrA family ABC transporter ATP-binding protein [Streptomyces sp. NBRC 14336]|uniref:ABC transporter ATP-binding protein n=1 Tax=Streptomyces sp. NBRC 14336 TaxID=3030992 RepID=UPI0024A4C327|nr:ABC transporter ATP-binding protein [Streptomyces sp. NBRC 14336]WBO76223.1 ABC transporter ATP-binding protein [Streptomyces sp. SBE_14.2]GLW46818.1 daunorubicin resistance protein DrrA family ABC transporter ATP-binding protein [Streptomyces sp. NBRC 14336]